MQQLVSGGLAAKFRDPDYTAKGEPRATVALTRLETLWINTGTLCNITCRNCYIESSPENDRLVYISRAEQQGLLTELERDRLGPIEIGYTGGEPFLNPDMLLMLEDSLAAGHTALVLTNAMQPMQRPRVKSGLKDLNSRYSGRLRLRISLDHHSKVLHESERGERTWSKALSGLDWLASEGLTIAIAGRTCWGESEAQSRDGYARLIGERGWPIDPSDSKALMLLPEMETATDVPEISTSCWGLLGKRPADMMCASSRMVVKRKGAAGLTILPCTLLPYEPAFEMGATLAEAATADGGMFTNGAVKLCHVNCAKFCVVGGGSCS